MRRITLVLAVAAAFALVREAPAEAGRRLEVGPKAGLVFSTFVGSGKKQISLTEGEDPSYVGRGHVGAVVTLVLNDKLSIQTEPAYTQRGAEWEKTITVNDTSETGRQTIDVGYFEIPLLLKFTVPTSGRFRPYLAGGPAVTFHVHSEAKIVLESFHGGVKVGYWDAFADNIENIKGTLFEVVGAGGVEMTFSERHKLMLEGRYTRSFGQTFEDVADINAVPAKKAVIADDTTGKAPDLQLSAFTILIGYSYGFDL